tara:strand:+ start:21720 stop:22151 length:432 start_codon:yes stop_codon:yes gene_type:complete
MKPEVKQALLNRNGIEGDYNHFRATKRGNNPDMALLVLPIEIIHKLNEEGWPINIGDLGENLVTEGVPIDNFIPNLMIDIGTVKIQLSYKCDPCYKLHSLPYVGKKHGVEFVKTMLGRRGWYARVLKGGRISSGDTCSFEETN